MAGLEIASLRGRVDGRPPVMTLEKVAVARQVYDSQDHTVEAIAKTFQVNRKTIYRHLGPPQVHRWGISVIISGDVPVICDTVATVVT